MICLLPAAPLFGVWLQYNPEGEVLIMNFSKRIVLAALASVALSSPLMAMDMIGNCEVTGQKGSIALAAPAKAGQFTVAVSLPAPVWWNGDTPESIKDGMEYCMAAEIAWRAGYDKLEVVNVGWDALIAGQTNGWDMAMSEISITEDRKKVHDFSISYFNSDMGVITRADTPVDEKTIKTAKVGVQQGTTGAQFAVDKLGIAEPNTYDDQGSMFAALRAGQIDAAITDTSITLAEEAATAGKSKVIGQYKSGETYGAIYPKGNPNNATIDKIMQSMLDDGSIGKMGAKYLAAAWGKDPATIPYINP
jgi:polar amino acid transport system substrate-binding protein